MPPLIDQIGNGPRRAHWLNFLGSVALVDICELDVEIRTFLLYPLDHIDGLGFELGLRDRRNSRLYWRGALLSLLDEPLVKSSVPRYRIIGQTLHVVSIPLALEYSSHFLHDLILRKRIVELTRFSSKLEENFQLHSVVGKGDRRRKGNLPKTAMKLTSNFAVFLSSWRLSKSLMRSRWALTFSWSAEKERL